MRLLGLLIFCLALLWTALATADPCRQIEYAELQDIATGDLARTYCESERMAEIEERKYVFFSKSAGSADKRSEHKTKIDKRSADKAEQNWRGCTAMQARIITTLKKRGVSESPPCDAPSTNK